MFKNSKPLELVEILSHHSSWNHEVSVASKFVGFFARFIGGSGRGGRERTGIDLQSAFDCVLAHVDARLKSNVEFCNGWAVEAAQISHQRPKAGGAIFGLVLPETAFSNSNCTSVIIRTSETHNRP